jgi:Na+/H+ antiporter NhaD/arsenite permease-like protein
MTMEGVGAVTPWMILPFGTLLLAIAVVPFISRHWWERFYPAVSLGLGLTTAVYYLVFLRHPERLLHTASEYLSFIVLIGSLFVVSGGILIRLRGRSTPAGNLSLLGIGAVVSNLIGTTGASMILIRPYLRVNRYRIRPYHVVFFIFVVSNMGGALTPIGDPPLFLGYLRGVPFFWVLEQVWTKWLFAMALIMGIFYAIDLRSFRALPTRTQHAAEETGEEGEVRGLHNVVFLVMILASVFITNPPFIRELVMIAAAGLSYRFTSREIHRRNEFNFIPIKEVAILFAGIFATMIPALDWLEMNAAELAVRTPGEFYFRAGSLSAVLDNAPTYLSFLSAQIGLLVSPDLVREVQGLIHSHAGAIGSPVGVSPEAQVTYLTLVRYHADALLAGTVTDREIAVAHIIGNHALYLQAISVASVFFGACTYIGNGPNFMVKSIADQAGVETPSFFGYVVRYTVPVLLPIFVLVWWLFFTT